MRMIYFSALSILVAMCSCHRHTEGPGTAPDPSCQLTHDTPCTGLLCGGGGNSPFLNVFPLNGMNFGGSAKCNLDAAQVIPGSLENRRCGENSDLGLSSDQTKLVGWTGGSASCAGKQLEGAQFTVRRGNSIVILKIAEVREHTSEGKTYEGYRIESEGQPVCSLGVARRVQRALRFGEDNVLNDAPLEPGGYAPDPDDDLAIVVGGPIFSVKTGAPLNLSPSEFINLACVGDALAKTVFWDMHHNAQETTMALRMITANYCGQPLTLRGMKIEFEELPDSRVPRKLEAKWGADGKALCIDNPRLIDFKDQGNQVVPPQKLPRYLQPSGCVHGEQGGCDEAEWLQKLRAQCHTPEPCSKISMDLVRLQSFTDNDGSKVIGSRIGIGSGG